MQSHEAMRLLIGGDSIPTARRLGVSSRLVQRWCEPNTDYSDQKAYNPLDRLEGAMEEAKRLKKSPREIYAPIRYLVQDEGIFIPLPKCQVSCESITLQMAKTMKEVGEAMAAAGKALEDMNLTPAERSQTMREMDQAIHELLTLAGMFHG